MSIKELVDVGFANYRVKKVGTCPADKDNLHVGQFSLIETQVQGVGFDMK